METHTLDASKEPLGRLATRVAVLLMGKHRPTFERYRKNPVRVIVTHADDLILTGKKMREKRYYRHSGYLGHLKEFRAQELKRRDSRELVRLAISGMLPKNKLRKQLLKNLVIHRGESQEPKGKNVL